VNTALRIGLLVWVVGYLFLSCSPILGGDLIGGSFALLGGLILFIPWLIGIVVLGLGIWLTNPPPRR
jgi:hypothetical protein